jgi:four helix bundle protein
MPTSDFTQLRVYQRSEEVADLIWDIVGSWNLFARDTVGKQIVRAADSIGANIAEGCGRGAYADNRRFVRIARGSLNETRHWLRRAFRRKLLTPEQIETLASILEIFPKQLNAYLRSIRPSGNGTTPEQASPPTDSPHE